MSFQSIIPGLGVTVHYATTATSPTYTLVGQLKGIGGIGHEVGTYDATGISSTSSELVPTIFKAGELPITVHYDPANTTHVALMGYVVSKTALYIKVTFPSPVAPDATAPGSAKTLIFWAYVTKSSISGFEAESGLEAEFTFSITGAVTYA